MGKLQNKAKSDELEPFHRFAWSLLRQARLDHNKEMAYRKGAEELQLDAQSLKYSSRPLPTTEEDSELRKDARWKAELARLNVMGAEWKAISQRMAQIDRVRGERS
jgi:hypothetical protein